MNNYRITREGDDDSPTMSLCVERNVKAKKPSGFNSPKCCFTETDILRIAIYEKSIIK